MGGDCAWCGQNFDPSEGQEWSAYESLMSGDPEMARLKLWLSPSPDRFKPENLEPIVLELHPGECYQTARDELRRALFAGRSFDSTNLLPDRKRARLPHGWWHMIERPKPEPSQKGE